MKKMQIYILCRDRRDFAKEAISSVLVSAKKCIDQVEVIISDNSVGNAIEQLRLEHFADVAYIRRKPPLPVEQHFKVIINEAQAEYLVLFHDDDRMGPDYISTMLLLMEQYPRASAIGCNGEIIDAKGQPTGRYFIKPSGAIRLLKKSEELVLPYLQTMHSPEIAPFPGYCYRKQYLCENMIDIRHGGKHSDVTLLIKLLHKSNMIWTSHSLMEYRLHGANDSAKESIPDRSSLLRYLCKYEGISRHSPEVREFRFSYWLAWWKQHGCLLHWPKNHRERVVFNFLLRTILRWSISEPFIWRILWRKLNKGLKGMIKRANGCSAVSCC